MRGLLIILIYLCRNFLKMLFWGFMFLIFYGLNELVKDL